ncbi:hypothetical protein P691DRAFT_767808 [Macrolepiota fuliginosa MF-IS2]|uniref:Uncharacterized protein n=1 Tax=Macrolepiota fuliginosa MF-IS2 TaxID=1400762 RepID=A0A9P6BUN5_9AGAR|nr:hypothetical protein P691DRAFT_767808 [Macrolepiota fuliginosa MF-IS2]
METRGLRIETNARLPRQKDRDGEQTSTQSKERPPLVIKSRNKLRKTGKIKTRRTYRYCSRHNNQSFREKKSGHFPASAFALAASSPSAAWFSMLSGF